MHASRKRGLGRGLCWRRANPYVVIWVKADRCHMVLYEEL